MCFFWFFFKNYKFWLNGREFSLSYFGKYFFIFFFKRIVNKIILYRYGLEVYSLLFKEYDSLGYRVF